MSLFIFFFLTSKTLLGDGGNWNGLFIYVLRDIWRFDEVLLADIKPSSTTKQGLCQSLSYSGSPCRTKERTFRAMDPGEDEAAAKRVDEVYQDLLSLYTVQFISNK